MSLAPPTIIKPLPQEFPRYLGEKQSWFIKVVLGGLLLIGLVMLIWGPLLVMSVIATNTQANQPTEVSIRLSLAGYEVRGGVATR